MRASPHEIGLPDLLAVARLRGTAPAQITLFGMQPEVIELGWELSDSVAQELDHLVDAVVYELVGCGLPVTPVSQPVVALETRHA
jgi:hydrogenase maturation protease